MSGLLLKEPYWLATFRPGRHVCPECSPQRKPEHRSERTLRVTQDSQGRTAYCHHCEMRAVMTNGFENRRRDERPGNVVSIEDRRSWTEGPKEPPKRLEEYEPLAEDGIEFLASRGIAREVAEFYGVVSGERFFPERQGLPAGRNRAIGFRYTEAGKHTATKWRALSNKRMVADGSCAGLWGPPILPGEWLIITEGEPDAMAAFQAAGIKAKSLPAGATDNPSSNTKFGFLDVSFDDIKNAAGIILFLDNDVAGRATQKEMARRIGRAKCWQVALPEDRKDANEVLQKDGVEALKALIEARTPYPVEGIVRVADVMERVRKLHKDGLPKGMSTGIPALDPYITIQGGMLYVVTGRPGAGKSTALDQISVNLADRLKWHWTMCSFESPQELHIARLMGQKERQPFSEMDDRTFSRVSDWANDHYSFLSSDSLVSIDSVLDRAAVSITRYGSKGLVIDPYNFLRDQKREADTEYANEVVAKMKMFCTTYDVAGFLVAHPSKPKNDVGQDWNPTGYNISGSANFFNRADFGLTWGRTAGADEMEGDAQATIWKCRWNHLGKEGNVILSYDSLTQRFYSKGPRPIYEGDEREARDPWA